MSQPKTSINSTNKAKRKNAAKKVVKPQPEVSFSSCGLEDEFRRQLCEYETLDGVHAYYLEWLEQVEELIEEFGQETTVAEIRKKMD